MNQWTGIGNLGADPVVYTTPSGRAMTLFRLAIDNRYYTGADDNRRLQKTTDWIPVVVWGQLADTAGKYLQKGSKVAIAGKLRTREYQDESGQPQRSIQVHADSIEFLDKIRSPEVVRDSEVITTTVAAEQF